MTTRLNMTLKKDTNIQGFQDINWGPLNLTIAKGGELIQRTMTVTAGKWSAVEVPDGTPWLWAVVNTGSENAALIGFGQGEEMRPEAQGIPCMWTGSKIPYISAEAGTTTVVVLCILEAT